MPRTLFHDLARGFVQLIYPAACLACGSALTEGERDLCGECGAGLFDDPHPTCPRCASTLGPNLGRIEECGHCRGQSLGFDRAIRLGPYAGIRREIILKLKHSENEGLAEAVGELWAGQAREMLRDCGITAAVPAPAQRESSSPCSVMAELERNRAIPRSGPACRAGRSGSRNRNGSTEAVSMPVRFSLSATFDRLTTARE